jgi:branched-chain amino acid transport system permease protein
MSLDIRRIGAALVLLILVGLPFGLGNYGYYILATIMIYSIVSLSLNVLIGMGGQISIGHAGFWALAFLIHPNCRNERRMWRKAAI